MAVEYYEEYEPGAEYETAALVSIPIGIYSATRQYSPGDYVFTFIGFMGLAIPNFLFALILLWITFEATGTADDPACCDDKAGTINHLGVETETVEQVIEAEKRLSGAGLDTTGVDDTMCCYAEKSETWVTDPDGSRWEWYVRTGDSEILENVVVASH